MSELQRQEPESSKSEGAARKHARRGGPVGDLVSMRMITFFNVLRRSGILTQKRQFGLSEVEWRIITQVSPHAPLSLNGLAELTLQDRGQLSRAVKALVERGLLIRERKPGGPEIEIDLSEEGRELYARMVERAIERDRRLTRNIPEEDLAALWRIMDRMIDEAEEMLQEELQFGS